MQSLSPQQRRALRAKAHHLHPFVSIGQHGLTSAVLHEIDVALLAHELVKIRVFSDDRAEREGFFARICEALDAAPVQHLGKLLIVWRPAPEPAPVEPKSDVRRGAGPRGSEATVRRPATGGRKPHPATTPDPRRRRKTATTPELRHGKPGATPAAARGEGSRSGARQSRHPPASAGPRGHPSGTRRRKAR